MIHAPKLIGLRFRHVHHKAEGVLHAVAFTGERFVLLVLLDEGDGVDELREWSAEECIRVDDEERLAQLAERGLRARPDPPEKPK
jgi:hypothetical protein